MRLPITDQFLWMVYNFFEKTGEILEPPEIFKLKTMREAIYPQSADFWRNLEKKRSKRQFAQFVHYLKKKGYIKIAALKEKKGILLTPRGREKILKVKIELKNKRKRKDGKWIMLMYDIPERRKKERFLLRAILKNLGYQQFQKSIWVCPYDVLEESKEATRIYFLDPYIKTFLIEEIHV